MKKGKKERNGKENKGNTKETWSYSKRVLALWYLLIGIENKNLYWCVDQIFSLRESM